MPNEDHWLDAWNRGLTPWSDPGINQYLRDNLAKLRLTTGCTILVPMCGDSADMVWLAEQGHNVVGIDISHLAIESFFSQATIAYNKIGNVYTSKNTPLNITIINENIFNTELLSTFSFDAIYDKGALVTVPHKHKPKYILRMHKLAPRAKILLITAYYRQAPGYGAPPFLESVESVQSLYREHYSFSLLEHKIGNDNQEKAKAQTSESQEHIVALLQPYSRHRPLDLPSSVCAGNNNLCKNTPMYAYEAHSYCSEHYPLKKTQLELSQLLSNHALEITKSAHYTDNMRSFRYFMYKEFGLFGFPTVESARLLSAYISTTHVYDLGCGVGYLSYALKKYLPNKKVLSYDYGKLGRQEYGLSQFKIWSEVIERDVLTDHLTIENATIILSWPDSRNDFCYHICQRYIASNLVIYIGETEGGKTASDLFFKHFDLIPLPIPWHSWSDTKELCFIVKKKNSHIYTSGGKLPMSIQEMNSALIQLYTNDIYRKYFFENKNHALRLYPNLSEEQREAIKSISEEELDTFSIGLKQKLKTMVAKYFSPLFEFDSELMSDIFSRFYLNRKLANCESIAEYAKYFGEFAKEYFEETKAADYLYDIAKYQTQRINATITTYPEFNITSAELNDTACAVLAPHIFVERYRFDINQIIKCIGSDSHFKASPEAYLMYNTHGDLLTKKISMPLYDLLSLCNGSYTLKEMFAILKPSYADLSQEKTKETIEFLVEANYIYISQPSGTP